MTNSDRFWLIYTLCGVVTYIGLLVFGFTDTVQCLRAHGVICEDFVVMAALFGIPASVIWPLIWIGSGLYLLAEVIA